jgi:hypothetical protein
MVAEYRNGRKEELLKKGGLKITEVLQDKCIEG